jgi:hypothetical protein
MGLDQLVPGLSVVGVPGGGTVTGITFDSPLTAGGVPGGTIHTAGHAGIQTNDATHAGVVPASGGGIVNFWRADGTWADPAGSGSDAVSLQLATPGTPDTGNFNVSGTGFLGYLGVGQQFDPSGDDNLVEFVAGDGIQGGLVISTNAVGWLVQSGTGVALKAQSEGAASALFQSASAANTAPTLVTQQAGIGTANLFEGRLTDDTKILQFNPIGARLGLGNLPGLPDTMLHLFGDNTFTGSAAIIVQNDSRTDLSNVSKLCFADTNTATTLSNACIVFQPQSGGAGDLQFWMNGADNDTPGFPTLVLSGLDFNVHVVGGVSLVLGDTGFGGTLNVSTGDGFNSALVSTNTGGFLWSVGNTGVSGGGGVTFLTVPNTGIATFGFAVNAPSFVGPLTGNVTGVASGNLVSPLSASLDLGSQDLTNGVNATFNGQVGIGGSIGSHALDVTGDAYIVSGTTAEGVGLSVYTTSGTNGAGYFNSADGAGLEVVSGSGLALQAGSLGGFSAYFRTSATDGSNVSPTVVIEGNTGQAVPLQEWRGNAGAAVANMSPTGVMTASAYLTASQQAAFVASPFGAGAGQTGEMRFLELVANGTNYVGFKAPDGLGGDLMYTLPTTDAAGPLMSNGSGILNPIAGASLVILVPVANKTLTFTNGVLTAVV